MVLDFVPGQSLEEYIREGALSINTTLNIASQLAEALAYAHSNGIFHRDLKPTNVLLVENNDETLSVRLIDFGVAKLSLAQEPTIVQGITVVGTPQYMSPDQVNGHRYDARSEIYSLGCIMFECLTGGPPFRGDTAMELIARHSKDKPPNMAALAKQEIPKELQAVVDRCLMKAPKDRYESMTELKDEIDALIAITRDSNQAGSISISSEPSRQGKSNSRILILSVSLLVIVFAVFSFKLMSETKKTDTETTKKTQKAEISRFIFNGQSVEPALNVHDDDLKELSRKSFSKLYLSDTPIKGSGFRYLKECQIKFINLDRSAIENRYFKYLNQLPDLHDLSLSETDTNIDGLKQLTDVELHGLHVTGCRDFNDECLDLVIERWPNIKALSVGRTGITDDALTKIARMPNLTYLGITGMKASKEQLEALKKSTIRELFCAESTIDDSGLSTIATIKSLKIVSIRDCHSLSNDAIEQFKKSRPDVDCRVIGGQLRKKRVDELKSLLIDSEEVMDMDGKSGITHNR